MMPKQMVPRGCMYHYPGRNVADANMEGVGCGMLLVPYDMVGVGGMLPGDVVAAIQQTMEASHFLRQICKWVSQRTRDLHRPL
ncbi:hypothetical protein L1987_01000 [Smallanthus sonchifolius]|uniref:Uncharacterized protein n=1 Tax=Smallanthus sonchifolius TaxID=185202 RepID=A0ACB9K434_9ASTR|nr:hypothetical protein L1987_01000 [Smallanthus sonchifolius]